MNEKPIYNEQLHDYEKKKEAMIKEVAELIHEKWRATRWLENERSYEPRIKTTKDEAWIRAHGGNDQIDIANTDFSDLPADWQEENYFSARVAMDKLADVLDIIHDRWLDRNDNRASEEQKKQFSRLPAAEKLKDVAILEDAVAILKKHL